MSLLRRVSDSGCWEWTAARLPTGYGVVSDNTARPTRTLYVHRLAWEIARGPIPKGSFVCHRCDNPSCCNPEHLFLGSPRDNVRDAMAKGRMKFPPRDPRPCDFPNCLRKRRGRYCAGHAQQLRRGGLESMRPLGAWGGSRVRGAGVPATDVVEVRR